MIFNTTIPFDKQRAQERLDWLIEKEKSFEIIVKNKRRSIAQNSYLHLILTWYAIEYGETVGYIKQEVFKKEINPSIFKTEHINKKMGEVRIDWKSTSELDSTELTTAIDRFRNYSAKEAGIYLPEPNDIVNINAMEHEINKHNSQYL